MTATRSTRRTPLRALLIEDDPEDVEILEELLAEGARIDEEEPEIELVREERLAGGLRHPPDAFDLVLLDLALPDSRGLPTLQRVREHYPDLPLVVLTGLEGERLGLLAVRGGADDYLPKNNLDVELLWRTIHFALERKCRTESLQHQVHALERQQQRLTGIFGGSAAGLIVVDGAGQVCYINQTAEEALARARDSQIAELFRKPPLAGPRTLELKGDEETGQGPLTIAVRACQTRWEEEPAYLLTLHDAAGEAVPVDGEQQTRLRRAERLAGLDRLAGGLAHDLNNLLMTVLGGVELARRRLFPDAPLREQLDQISRAVEQAAELTGQLQAFAGDTTFELQPLDLNRLVGEARRLARAAATSRVSLEIETAPELPLIEADPAQVRQLLLHLVTNAAEAARPGGIVRVRTSLVELDQDAARALDWFEKGAPGPHVVLEVADDGPGIDPAVLERIYEPFFGTRAEGRGLGLAVVLGIVRGHRGGIQIDSGPQGTTVQVLLPVPAGRVVPRERRKAAGERPAGGLALLVDDEPEVREVTRGMLEELGFEVLQAGSGLQALDCFREHAERLRLVLMDLTMPGLSGVESARLLHEVRADVPVVLASGYRGADLARSLSDEGLAAFLRKPYSLEALEACLAGVLRT